MTVRQVLEAERPPGAAVTPPWWGLVPPGGELATGEAASASGTEARILAGALACIARYGVAKTTLDDIAREAGCSRATVYRYVGGKEELLTRLVRAEATRIGREVMAAASAAQDLTEALVAMAVTAARALLGHEALRFVLAHEPEAVLSFIAFEGGDRFLARCADALAPTFARFVGPQHAGRVAEWCTRVLLAYLTPYDAVPLDLTDPDDARRLISAFVLPGVARLAASPAPDLRTPTTT